MTNLLLPVAFFGPEFIAISIPLAGIFFAGVVVVSGLYFKHQREKLWHDTARLALEKGQPIPNAPQEDNHHHSAAAQPSTELAADHARGQRIRGLMIAGLVNIAVGAGLFLALSKLTKEVAFFATIPGFIGIALILAALFDAAFSRKASK